eukprot:6132516-Pyramimonas_sp.AAC.1
MPKRSQLLGSSEHGVFDRQLDWVGSNVEDVDEAEALDPQAWPELALAGRLPKLRGAGPKGCLLYTSDAADDTPC